MPSDWSGAVYLGCADMAVNWGLAGNGNNALQMFQFGASLGQDIRQRQQAEREDNALRAYATNPDEEALQGVIAADPRLGIQLQGQRAQQAAAQREQRRADLPILARLVNHARDEPTYQQSLAAARSYGLDVSQAPANFDPNWIGQQKMLIESLQKPNAQEALSTAGKQAFDEGLQPGTPQFAKRVTEIWQQNSAIPYVGEGGETRLYIPGQQQAPETVVPPPEAIAELQANPGTAAQFDEVFGPGASERVLAGHSLSAAHRARSITSEEAARVRASLGPNGQAAFDDWVRRNSIVIRGR